MNGDGFKFFLLLVLGLLAFLFVSPQAGTALIGAGDALEQERVQGTRQAVQAATEFAIAELTRAAPTPDFGATQQAIQAQVALDALVVEQARGVATAEAQATAFAVAVAQTSTVQALHLALEGATATAQTMNATATAQYEYGVLERQQQAAKIEWQNTLTTITWILVSALGVCLLAGLGWVIWTRETTRRDRANRMDWSQVQMNRTPSGVQVIAPALLPGPVLTLAPGGQAVAPALAPWEVQEMVTMAVQRVRGLEAIARAYAWYDRVAAHAENALPAQAPAQVLPEMPPQPLPLLDDRHILIAGPTGSGKTHTARYLLQARRTAFVLDPHYTPGEWPAHCQVVGGGRDFTAIGTVIENMVRLMDERFKVRATGKTDFQPVTLVTDEVPALAANLRMMMTHLMQIAREGRKVKVYLFLITQSVLVRELGIEGHGEVRHNFATIRLKPLPPGTPEDTPRVAQLTVGEFRAPEIDEARMIPAGLREVEAKPLADGVDLLLPVANPVPQAVHTLSFEPTAEEIREHYEQSGSKSETARHFFGYPDGAAFRKVQAALKEIPIDAET